jgi:hypothetical protein
MTKQISMPALCVIFFAILIPGMAGKLDAAPVKSDSLGAVATLSHRGVKVKHKVELIVTVCGASNPVIDYIDRPQELVIRRIRRRQLLHTESGDIWLFRYRLLPLKAGDYEIPAINVIDGGSSTQTKPLFLNVSENGDLPALTARELSYAVNIPLSLSEEVLKSAPQPTPKPLPTPKPRDLRPFGVRAATSLQHFIKAFWEYPGG